MLTALSALLCLTLPAVMLALGALFVGPAPSHSAGAAEDCPAGREAIVRTAPGAGKTVALTFDDGPTKFTPKILKVLREHNVRATFFQPGNKIAAGPGRAAQVAAEGHLIANHTYDHRYPTEVAGGWTRSYLRHQLRRSNRLIAKHTGQQACFFRPPGGYLTAGLTSTVANHGMTTVMWSVDTEDWKQPGRTSRTATNRIISRAKAGASQTHPIILMHDGKASREPEQQVSSNRSNNVAALPAIIKFYKERGYRFVDMLGRSGLPAAPTTLTLAGADKIKRPLAGNRVVVAAGRLRALTGPVRDVRVRWYHRDDDRGTWQSGGTTTTNDKGRFAVTDRPTDATRYKVEFPGNRHYAASKGDGYRLVIPRTVATSLTVSGPDSTAAGTSAPVNGIVRSNDRGRSAVPVTIRWETTDSTGAQTTHTELITTSADGTFTWQVPATATTIVYTFSVAADLPYEAAIATHTVTVTI